MWRPLIITLWGCSALALLRGVLTRWREPVMLNQARFDRYINCNVVGCYLQRLVWLQYVSFKYTITSICSTFIMSRNIFIFVFFNELSNIWNRNLKGLCQAIFHFIGCYFFSLVICILTVLPQIAHHFAGYGFWMWQFGNGFGLLLWWRRSILSYCHSVAYLLI